MRAATVLRRALGTAAVLLLLVLLLEPGWLAGSDPRATGDDILAAPSAAHWFGTDQLGRDVLSRVVHGSAPVLWASLGGVLVATAAGVTVGVLGAFAPRLVAAVVMRVVDVMLALPVLLVALILISTVGSGPVSIVIAIGVAFTPGFARVVESSVRTLRSVEYVQAARVFGSTGLRTSVRHLLPNLLTEVVVLVSSGIGWAVLTATTLSFLGLGVRLPGADWGSDLAAGATNLSTAWWLSTFPGLAITVTILLANFLGDAATGLLDPRFGRRRRLRLGAAVGIGVGIGGPAALAADPAAAVVHLPDEPAAAAVVHLPDDPAHDPAHRRAPASTVPAAGQELP